MVESKIKVAPSGNMPELSVSELAGALKRTVEDRFGLVRVRGEISNYRGPHSSGHVYFSLKDQNARLDAVIWKGAFARLKTRPEEGLEVVATGKITTFPGKSSYQIVIDTLEPAGVGALMALLDERRRTLAAEGLFDETHKKPLPFLPVTIGVVTSPTGAVIRDILHRINDRFPRRVLVWPARVQGETAAAEVAAAITGFNALPLSGPIPRPDVLIVARGGGSLEDLWAFNEEIVIRAVAASAIPVVSAIGHETDTTLIDFVSDLRAPTPTGAAEKIVPVRVDLLAEWADVSRRLSYGQQRLLERARKDFSALARHLPKAEAVLNEPRQKLDSLGNDLRRASREIFVVQREALQKAAVALSGHAPQAELAKARARFMRMAEALARLAEAGPRARRESLAQMGARLKTALQSKARMSALERAKDREALNRLARRVKPAFAAGIERRRVKLLGQEKLLASLSYRNVLARGFALVRDDAGAPVRAARNLSPTQNISLEFSDGAASAIIAATFQGAAKDSDAPHALSSETISSNTMSSKTMSSKKAVRKPDSGSQGSLF